MTPFLGLQVKPRYIDTLVCCNISLTSMFSGNLLVSEAERVWSYQCALVNYILGTLTITILLTVVQSLL